MFKIADDNGLLLLDLKDLRAMLRYVGDNASQFTTQYGNISAASVGIIQRGLLQIESQGGEKFFGEPMLNIQDFLQTDDKGHGVANILAADKLLNSPRLYATFLLWMLSELFEQLPEIGDPDKPKLVFFFDEAHLLFDEAPKVLVERIELVVRLVRSKGVGVYFVTQNPLDIPDSVLAQLGNRVQHALRAYTPRDQKAVKATAQTMRQKPGLDIETAITELAVGEALLSLLDAKGRPSVTERAYVLPPGSQIGPITPAQRQALIANSLGRRRLREDRRPRLGLRAAQGCAPQSAPGRCARRRGPAPGGAARGSAGRGRRHAGRPARRDLRLDRAARRPSRRHGREHGQVRRAQHRQRRRARNHPRRAGRHHGEQAPLTSAVYIAFLQRHRHATPKDPLPRQPPGNDNRAAPHPPDLARRRLRRAADRLGRGHRRPSAARSSAPPPSAATAT